jgi:hypothetical protein
LRALALVALLAATGAVAGLWFWVQPPVPPLLVTVPVSEYKDLAWPANPWAEQDSDLLRSCFQEQNDKAFDYQELERFRDLLKSLRGKTGRPVVLHLTALATVHGGRVYLLPADAAPAAPDTWLPFEDVLQALASCPAKHKLLLLDVAHPLADPFYGPLADDVATRLHERLARGDLSALVFCSCSPSEFSLPLDEERSSVFAHYLADGLRGAADGSNQAGERDGQVSARELAAFVTARVGRWADRARGARQTPRLYGDAPDFTLSSPPLPTPDDAAAPPAAYPGWLLAGWQRRDGWRADGSFRAAPAAFGHLEAALLRAERAWEAGLHERAEARLAGELAARQAQLDPARPDRLIPPLPPRSLAAARAGQPDLPELRKALETFLEVRAAVPPKPEEVKKHREAFVEKAKAQRVAAAGLVWDRLLEITEPALETVRDLSALFQDFLPAPYTETVLVRRLATWEPRRWPTSAVHSLLASENTAEQTLALLPAAFPWVRGRLDDADRRRRDGEAKLFAADSAGATAEAKESLDQAEREFRDIQRQWQTVADARRAVEDAAVVLAGAAPGVVERGGAEEREWMAAARAARGLADRLARAPDGGALTLTEWEGPTRELRNAAQRLEQPYAPAAVKKAAAAAKDGGMQQYQALQDLLRGPLLTAADRKAVWEAARQLARRLHEEVQALDADDQLLRPTAPPIAPDGAEAERAGRRARVSAELLLLTGLGGVADPRDAARRAAQGDQVAELADALRDAWLNRLPRLVQERTARQDWTTADRLARVPGPERGLPAAGRAERPPAARLRRQEAQEYRQWLAARYRDLGRLRGKVPGADVFYEEAADDCLSRPLRE